jgi:hypothetical protein
MDYWLSPTPPGANLDDYVKTLCALCGQPYLIKIKGATGKMRLAMQIAFGGTVEQLYLDLKTRLAYAWLNNQKDIRAVWDDASAKVADLMMRAPIDDTERAEQAAWIRYKAAYEKRIKPLRAKNDERAKHDTEEDRLTASIEVLEHYLFGEDAANIERGELPNDYQREAARLAVITEETNEVSAYEYH